MNRPYSRNKLPRRLWVAAVLAGAAFGAGQAQAIGLLAAYEAALKNDPNYRAAYYDNVAGQENKVMGKAGLLPVVSASYTSSRNRIDLDTTSNNSLGLPHTVTTQPQYISRSAVVQMRQPLVSFEAAARYREGLAQTKLADARFDASGQELAVRVVSAYFDALYAVENVNQLTAQRDAYREQSKVNARLFEKGEGSKTDVIETQARLDLAESQLLDSLENQKTAHAILASMVGLPVDVLSPMENFQVGQQQELTLDEWKSIALKNNAEVRSRTLQVDLAREGVNKGRAAQMPRLDLFASYGKSAAETISTSNQDNLTRSVGIQLNVPIYTGGYASAASRQAVANFESAKADLQASVEKVLVDVRKEYALTASGSARIAAMTKAVDSNKLLVTATEQSIKGGIRINLDLLNARRDLYISERELAQARYTYLLASLRLRAAAGTLAMDDVRQLATHFK